MFFVTIYVTDLRGCYGSTVTRDKNKSITKRSYLIFIVLEKQKLILLGHEINAAISVGAWDFQMPKCWVRKFFHKLLQNLPNKNTCLFFKFTKFLRSNELQ